MMILSKKGLIGTLLIAGLVMTGSVLAGGTIKIDDTKWLSIGGGLITNLEAIDNGSANNNWSNNFNLGHARLYFNGQVHDNIKFEFNTECGNCSGSTAGATDIFVLDAIAKFEFNDMVNVWVGRQLVPSDRAELDGPFYQNTLSFNRTPFYPNDQFNQSAGRYGRDDGINFWGATGPDNRLTYVAGVFDGNSLSDVNGDDNLLYAARVSYNLWNVENNPGYYTSSGYYGNAGDIFTISAATQYQEDGVGGGTTNTFANGGNGSADFWGSSVDVLIEKVLGNGGVMTAEGEWKHFELNGLSGVAAASANTSNIFEGNAYTGTLLYLMPGKVGIGQLQPYTRYTKNNASFTADSEEAEVGMNYIIDGYNARIGVWYQYGDINSMGRDYLSTTTGQHQSAVKAAIQIQF